MVTVIIKVSDADNDRDRFSLNIGQITSSNPDCNSAGDTSVSSSLASGKDPGSAFTSVQISTTCGTGTYTIPVLCFDEKVTSTQHFESATADLTVTVN